MKPRIAILHYSCYPVIGGVETVIEAHARLFASHKYDVKIIVGKGGIFDNRIRVKVIPEMDSLDKTNQIINKELDNDIVSEKLKKRVKVLYKKLKKALRKTDIAFVHNILTMHFNMPLTLALRKIIKENKTKFIAWCHDATFNDPVYSKKKKNKFPFDLLARPLDNIKYVSISELRRKQISELFKINKKDISVIPDGIHLNFLRLNKLTVDIFRFFELFKEELVLLTPARIVKRKNLELAVKIIKELNKTKLLNSKNSKGLEKSKTHQKSKISECAQKSKAFPTFQNKTKLIITGPPDPHNTDSMQYYNYLINLVDRLDLNDKVIFLYKFRKNGKRIYVSYDIIKDLFLLCDMLLFPSKQEGFGIPLLEAGLANKPIVCSNIATLKEVGGKDVLYFNINNKPDKIAKKIINYYNRHITKKMFKKVVREYIWESIFDKKIEPLIKSI